MGALLPRLSSPGLFSQAKRARLRKRPDEHSTFEIFSLGEAVEDQGVRVWSPAVWIIGGAPGVRQRKAAAATRVSTQPNGVRTLLLGVRCL
jgi:hypothetical protein